MPTRRDPQDPTSVNSRPLGRARNEWRQPQSNLCAQKIGTGQTHSQAPISGLNLALDSGPEDKYHD